MEAFFSGVRSRLELVVGDFEAAAADLDVTLTLLPRLAPGSNQTLQVLVVPMLRDVLGGGVLDPAAADVLLEFSDRPDTRWAGLALKLAAGRGWPSPAGRSRPGRSSTPRCRP